MGFQSYLGLRASDGELGCFAASPKGSSRSGERQPGARLLPGEAMFFRGQGAHTGLCRANAALRCAGQLAAAPRSVEGTWCWLGVKQGGPGVLFPQKACFDLLSCMIDCSWCRFFKKSTKILDHSLAKSCCRMSSSFCLNLISQKRELSA